MRKTLALAFALILSTGVLTSVAAARSPKVAGSYTIADLGQGGWGGGPLNTDGTIGGSAGFSYGNGQNLGAIQGTSWVSSAPGLVTLCFTDTATKGQPLFPSPSCFDVPSNGTPLIISEEPGEETLLRVTMP
jgi:hypothetical protein